MNAQLEQQIQADFPFMKLNKIDGEENLYRRWGCDCDDGWYNLIHDMCQAIADRYAEEGLPIDLIPTQLKEKFATLRFYYSFETLVPILGKRGELGFVTCFRVHGAGDVSLPIKLAEAGHAGDAGENVCFLSGKGFVGPVGVGQMRPGGGGEV